MFYMPVNYQGCKQGKFCKGLCDDFKLDMRSKGEKKYVNNARCTYCSKWVPRDEVIMIGIYHRCPCCHMKVRTKRWTNLSHV